MLSVCDVFSTKINGKNELAYDGWPLLLRSVEYLKFHWILLCYKIPKVLVGCYQANKHNIWIESSSKTCWISWLPLFSIEMGFFKTTVDPQFQNQIQKQPLNLSSPSQNQSDHNNFRLNFTKERPNSHWTLFSITHTRRNKLSAH